MQTFQPSLERRQVTGKRHYRRHPILLGAGRGRIGVRPGSRGGGGGGRRPGELVLGGTQRLQPLGARLLRHEGDQVERPLHVENRVGLQ